MHQDKKPNRLINEKSPYLLAHGYNPVDWFAWSQQALDKAKAEDKPIFLSIGYSSCHWCHVMEEECFRDQQVADLLNQAFVCIKVDREERPDLDAQYMAVCQTMGRNCGWPLNVILTPQLNPFYAASYIPKYSRGGMIGMLDLVPQVMQLWQGQRAQLELVGADIKDRIVAMEKRTPQKEPDRAVLQDTYDRLMLDFDEENGGFGSAPKFPTPHKLLYLLRHYKRTDEKNALAMVEKTLNEMRQGGIHDQLGFGFHRYSTDESWLVPHFEKMLYDQALLAMAYIEAYQATGANRYALVAKEILDYAMRDLASPQGGFYSAQDADTEGEEGKFYLWTTDQVFDTLAPADAELAVHIYGLRPEGNFVEAGRQSGKNVLHIAEPLEELAPYEGLTLQELIDRLHSIRDKLFEARKKRVAPAIDDKVLADWNGLMIAALAKAGNVLQESKYSEAATKAADFILTQMFRDDVLYHRYAKGETAIEGFLDDYAFLVYGLIELYEATFEEKYLQSAADLAEVMVAKFWDNENGGFYQTSEQTAMPKMKPLYDGATPSGNSVALHDLLWLSRLTNQPKYDKLATQMSQTFAREIEGMPEAFTFFVSALDFQLGTSYSVVIVGEPKEQSTQEMLNQLRKHYLPTTTIALKHPSKAGAGYMQLEGKATAYVCQNQTCLPPTNSTMQMLKQLGIEP
ncbi:MAG: thioredoxin domain-containing protein [Candidatus Bathyarchaeota archaeon]|nr:thioredoxin domain-containing protein [Candidatus Bathyarchaeota archaeon]